MANSINKTDLENLLIFLEKGELSKSFLSDEEKTISILYIKIFNILNELTEYIKRDKKTAKSVQTNVNNNNMLTIDDFSSLKAFLEKCRRCKLFFPHEEVAVNIIHNKIAKCLKDNKSQ